MSEEAIVVGWTPNARRGRRRVRMCRGRARGHRLVVVNATKGDAFVDERYAAHSDRAALESEVAEPGPYESPQTMGVDVAEQCWPWPTRSRRA